MVVEVLINDESDFKRLKSIAPKKDLKWKRRDIIDSLNRIRSKDKYSVNDTKRMFKLEEDLKKIESQLFR